MTDRPQHPSLRGRVIVVTGGGRGFGWHMTEALLRAGSKVLLTGARHPEELESAAEKAQAIAGPGRCLAVRADVTRWEDCQAVVAAALEAFGGIDVLINNAGRGTTEYHATTGPTRIPFYEVPVEGFRTVIETNLIGVFQMTRAVMPHFVSRRKGKIMSLSTSLTTMSAPGLSPYGASKAGLELTHRVWAEELAGTGIDINILLPGGASDTPFILQHMVPGEVGKREGLLPGDVVVPPAMWLCSDATDGVTGARIIAKYWDPALPPADAFAQCVDAHHALPGIM